MNKQKGKKVVTKGDAPKAIASPASTGGRGVSFEHRVQAVKLLDMCLGLQSLGIPDGYSIVELRFQTRVHGFQTDDLVCTIENTAGARDRVLIQIKSGLTARASAQSFRDAVGGAWFDFQNPEIFTKGRDGIVIIHDAATTHQLKGATTVAKDARLSLTAESWLTKVMAAGSSNAARRNAFTAFKDVVSACAGKVVSEDELYQFLKHVSLLPQDLVDERSSEHINFLNLIDTKFSIIGYKVDTGFVWSKLVTTCMELNASSSDVDVASLERHIGSDLANAFKLIREGGEIGLGLTKLNDRFSIEPGVAPGVMATTSALINQFSGQSAIPDARDSSANKLISNQLDHINSRIKEGKYQDALGDLIKLGEDLGPFDVHQKARWYLMRGACKWHIANDDKSAADDFLKAADICDDEDRLAAARVRGLLLKNDIEAAVQAGRTAMERYPSSLFTWLIATNAELLNGGSITEHDIPAEHRNEPDALLLVSWFLRKSGDMAGAASVARKALALPKANFFTREGALAHTLSSVTSDPVKTTFRSFSPSDLEELALVVSAFEPRAEKLWVVQSDEKLSGNTLNLGYAYIFLGREREALELLREARERKIDEPRLIRLEIEAYQALNELDKALAAGRSVISEMPGDALVSYAQVASMQNDLEAIDTAWTAANKLTEGRDTALPAIKSLRWNTLINMGRQSEVITQVEAIDVAAETKIPELTDAVQALISVGNVDKANVFLDRALALLGGSDTSVDRYLVASGLFQAQRFEESASLYEQLVEPAIRGRVFNSLIRCYLKLGAYAKAKQLLESLPGGWMNDNETRHLASRLANQVGDWALFKETSIVELAHFPRSASSWIARLMAAGRESITELQSVLATIPDVLEGSPLQQIQIATCEIGDGFEERGLNRLYQIRRMNLADVETAARHISAHLALRKELPQLATAASSVQAGTYFTIMDEGNRVTTRVIDPPSIQGLSNEGVFCSASDSEIASFMGATVGSVISIPQKIGAPKTFRVTEIGSAYRYLLEDAQKLMAGAITQPSCLAVLDIPKDESGNFDLSNLVNILGKSSETGSQVMQAYREAPFTIGMVCKMLGKDVFDAICSWPSGAAKLYVDGGNPEARTAALRLLQRTAAAYVIDAATLIELGRIDCLGLLSALPKVYCSTTTYALLREELERSTRFPSYATAIEHEGKISFLEITEKDRESRRTLLKRIISAIENHCETRPAYGPLDWKQLPQQLHNVLSDEEDASLSLCLEMKATLLCMDARLRLLAETSCSLLTGVWPQIFLLWAQSVGKLTKRDYSFACMKLFLSGRNFVFLDPEDMLYAIYQGDMWAGPFLSELRRHLAEDGVIFGNAYDVVTKFLVTMLGRGICQLGFFIETANIAIEGLARHKECPSNLADLLRMSFANAPSLQAQDEAWLAYLSMVIDGAIARANKPLEPTNFKGRVMFFHAPPILQNGLAKDDTVELFKTFSPPTARTIEAESLPNPATAGSDSEAADE